MLEVPSLEVAVTMGQPSTMRRMRSPLDLPDGARLVERASGAIADVEAEVALPGENARVEAEAMVILGGEVKSLEDLDSLTDEQYEQLAAIPDTQTQVVSTEQDIALIAAPWAGDADGGDR